MSNPTYSATQSQAPEPAAGPARAFLCLEARLDVLAAQQMRAEQLIRGLNHRVAELEGQLAEERNKRAQTVTLEREQPLPRPPKRFVDTHDAAGRFLRRTPQ